MLHLLAVADAPQAPAPYAEAVARLAGIRHALRLVDPFGGGPASDLDDDVASAWEEATDARRRCFDNRSERVIAGTAAGLEALLSARAAGREPNRAASARLAEEIRAGLDDVSRLMLEGGPVHYPRPEERPVAL